MKVWFKNILPLLFVAAFLSLAFVQPKINDDNSADCQADTSRIAVVELTVLGMDSITITEVQNLLDETCGVHFNFACWTDTVVFIEYDSLLTDKYQLMTVIREMGYQPAIRQEY
jgi:hypothetical protein